MKFIAKKLAIGLLIFSGAAQSQELSSKLVAYKDCHSSIDSLDFTAKPQVCNMSSKAITFMVSGKNIALIDNESLKISKLEIKGEDVRYNRKGDDTFKFGSFPKVEDNGEYAIFDVELKSAPFRYITSASLEGTIDIMTSKGVINEERNSINLQEPFSLKFGPLTISNQPKPSQEKTNKGGLLGDALSEGMRTAFLGEEGDSLVIYINGDHDSLVSLEVYENDKKLKQGWYTTSGSERKRNFGKPDGSNISMKLKYWNGMEKFTVPIKI